MLILEERKENAEDICEDLELKEKGKTSMKTVTEEENLR